MSGRHEARILAVQFLFQRDFNSGDREEALQQFWADRSVSRRVRQFAELLIRGVEAHREELDRFLQSCADHWDIRRMGGVDRNVMRVALFEMRYCPDIPPAVSINEAIEVAKELSTDESGRFVNGILDRARRELNRPARDATPTSTPSGV
jgi:N utilization substance protein B